MSEDPGVAKSGRARARTERLARRPASRLQRFVRHAFLALALGPAAACAQTLLDAAYDPANDVLVVRIAYQGSRPDHRFSIEWDACQQGTDGQRTTAGRLIDLDGDDVAKQDYRVRRRLALSGLSCRPAQVTIRLGPVSNRTVYIPAAAR